MSDQNNILDDFFPLVRIIIPLSLTIYIFAYREQKEISYALFKQKASYINIIYLTLSVVLFLTTLLNNYISIADYFLIPFLLVWMISLGFAYFKILYSINILKSISWNHHLFNKYASKTIDLLIDLKDTQKVTIVSSRKQNKLLKKISEKISKMSTQIEIIYQTFISEINFNLTIDFEEHYREYNEDILQYIESLNSNNLTELEMLPDNEYLNLYKMILKKNTLLLNHATTHNSYLQLNSIIDSFSRLTPNLIHNKNTKESLKSEKKYVKEYYKHIFESIKILNDNENDQEILTILQLLYSQEEQTDYLLKESDLLALSLATIIFAVEKNNMKLLTDLTNIMLNLSLVDRNKDSSGTYVQKDIFKKIEQNFKDQSNITENQPDLIDTTARIFILCAIKSIELGHYSCAGFLIKIMNKKVDPEKLKLILTDLKKNSMFTIHSLKDHELNKEILVELHIEFNFSRISFEYCLNKTILLIYIQQQFAQQHRLIESSYSKNNLININYFIDDKHTLLYLKKKVANLSREYGMIALNNDDNFLDRIIKC